MSVNRIQMVRNANARVINVPIKVNTDDYGRQDLLEQYVDELIEEVINSPQDYEVRRFSHQEFGNGKTNINYQMNFFNSDQNINTIPSISNPYITSYGTNFSPNERYYYANSFTNSFFKIDFYDNKNKERQKLYMTNILPVQQGKKENVVLVNGDNVEVRKPDFSLDYIGDKEGFFIYWLNNEELLNVTNFYMTCKFFNGKTGEFVRFINRRQNTIPSNKFNFNTEDYFYYDVELDYNNSTYRVLHNGARVGDEVLPIKFYEYVNPE